MLLFSIFADSFKTCNRFDWIHVSTITAAFTRSVETNIGTPAGCPPASWPAVPRAEIMRLMGSQTHATIIIQVAASALRATSNVMYRKVLIL